MSTIQNSDQFLVQRGTSSFKQSAVNLMSTIQDTDLMLIQRGENSFKVTCSDVKDQLGGGGKPAGPVLESVTLAQDAPVDGNRYTGKSFTTTAVNSGGQVASLEMTAKIQGSLDLKYGTEPIETNAYPGAPDASVVLTLTGATNLGTNILVGDTVNASASYKPTSGEIVSFVSGIGYTESGGQFNATWEEVLIGADNFDENSNSIGTAFSDSTTSPYEINFVPPIQLNGSDVVLIGYSQKNASPNTIGVNGDYQVRNLQDVSPVNLQDDRIVISGLTQLSHVATQRFSYVAGIEIDGQLIDISQGTVLTVADDTDLKLFQKGDEVQGGINIQKVDIAAKTITVDTGFKIDNINQDQVWSLGGDNTNISSPGGKWEGTFNGSDSPMSGGVAPLQNTTVTWTGNIPAKDKEVRIAYVADTLAVGEFNVGGQTFSALNQAGYGTVNWQSLGTFSADITSMSLSRGNVASSGGIVWTAIEVDGKVLADAVKDSKVWSKAGVSSGETDSPINQQPIAPNLPKAFNGNFGDFDGVGMGGGTSAISPYIYTFIDSIPYSNSVEFYIQTNENNMGYYFNGTNTGVSTGLDGWIEVATGSGQLEGFGVYNSNSQTVGTIVIKGIKLDGALLLDAGTDQGFGDTNVSTLTAKKGSGTISDITGSQVTITPFTDNCFKEGQWLTVDKLVQVTPLSDPIDSYDEDTNVITLTGEKDLYLFQAGDEVTLSSESGEAPTTSTIESIEADYRTMSSTTYDGTANKDTLFADRVGMWEPTTLQEWSGTVAVYFDENFVSWSQKVMNAAYEVHLYNLDGVMTCGWITGDPAGPYTYDTVITSSVEPVVKLAVRPLSAANIVGFWFSGNGTMQKICGWDGVNLQTITDKSWKASTQYTLRFADSAGLDKFKVGAVIQDDPSVVDGARDDDKWGGYLMNFQNSGRYWIVTDFRTNRTSWKSGDIPDVWEDDPIQMWANDPTRFHATRFAVQRRAGANGDLAGWRVPSRDVGGFMVTFYWYNKNNYWATPTTADFNEPTAQPTRKWRATWDNGVKWGNVNKTTSTDYSMFRRLYETDYKSTVVSVDIENKTVVVNGGNWDGYEGQSIEVPGLEGTGTVGSVDVAAKTITLSASNDQWADGFLVKGPTKSIGATTAYLDFDASGAVTGYRSSPVPPRSMTDTTMPKLTFPATFDDTGTAPDTEFADPNAYIQTSVQLKNESADSAIKESNVVVPETNTFRIAAGESSDNKEELKAMWTQMATHDQRVADNTAAKRQQSIADFEANLQRYSS